MGYGVGLGAGGEGCRDAGGLGRGAINSLPISSTRPLMSPRQYPILAPMYSSSSSDVLHATCRIMPFTRTVVTSTVMTVET